jgi:predicted esterase
MKSQHHSASWLPGVARLALLYALPCMAQSFAEAPGLHPDLAFADYPPEARAEEIVRRLLTPLAAAQVERTLEDTHRDLKATALDLGRERFTVFVPARTPEAGYALLVFIPPWREARLPPGWQEALERYDTVFVSAADSGNDADVLGRRAPLALVAAANLRRRLPIDATRVYIGGFSGGARVALRLALAYPDIFRGALLNAGSDPLDAAPPSPPSQALLRAFQLGSRIVYVTGAEDSMHLRMDAASQESLRHFCQFDYHAEITPRAAHEVAGAVALGAALRELGRHATAAADRQERCNASLAKQVDAQLGQVSALSDRGRRAQALEALTGVDRKMGGLAAPRSLALGAELNWRLPGAP